MDARILPSAAARQQANQVCKTLSYRGPGVEPPATLLAGPFRRLGDGVAAERIHTVGDETPLFSVLSLIYSEAQQQLWLSKVFSSARYS
jgi:hypothetical protein